MFEITTMTDATLKTFTPRVEKHGEDDVSAASLGLKITGPNTLLDSLQPGLRDALYKAVDSQDLLPGVEPSTPLLRTKGIEQVKLAATLEGWTLKIDAGIDEGEPLAVSGCKVDRFVVVPHEGGSIDLHFRVGSNDLSQEDAGWLFGHLQHVIGITLHAPEKKAEAIDGSTDAFKKDHPDATDLFAAGDGAGSAGPDEEGQGDDDGSGSTDADQAEAPRARRGRKTAAAVE